MEFFKPGRTFDFMRLAWRFWIPFSFVLLIGSIVLMIYPAVTYAQALRKEASAGSVRQANTE